MDLDIYPREEVVSIAGNKYVLSEPSEEATRVCQNKLLSGVEGLNLSNLGQTLSKAHGIADIDSLLVSMCLFSCKESDNGMVRLPVSVDTVRSWPHRTVKKLADRVRELGETDEGTLKNSPGTTTTGSG